MGACQIDDSGPAVFFHPLGQFHQAPVTGEKEHPAFLGQFGQGPQGGRGRLAAEVDQEVVDDKRPSPVASRYFSSLTGSANGISEPRFAIL